MSAAEAAALSNLQKVTQAYQKIMDNQVQKTDTQFCWIPDWHEEPMPLANKYGTEMNGAMTALSYPPEPPYQDPPNAAPLPGLKVLVFADSYGFATSILKYAPEGRIARKQIVSTPAAQLHQKPDKVMEILKEQWDMVIFGYGIDECPSSEAEAMHKHQTDCAKLLLMICKAVCDDKRLVGKMVCLACDTFAEEKEIHEEMGVRIITNAWLWGFANTARMEMDIPLHFIETEWSLPETSLPLLSSEVWRECTFGVCGPVRILKTGRYVLRKHNAKEYGRAGHDIKLADNTVVGISGGNGAVANIIGRWVVDKAIAQGCKGLRIEMLSRSMKIADENMPNWKALQKVAEENGVDIEQCKGDVGSQAGIDAWVEKHTPNIAGFIHSAGVLADTLMGNITWDEFEKVWQPKSRAALHLHFAFEKNHNPNLNFFWMFSSVAAWGNMGQVNYSAANAFMDGLARHRVAMGKPALAVQWGAWGEVGMAANLDDNSKRRMAQSPMPPFTNKEGILGTDAIVASGWPWGSVYKINGQFLVGMTSQEGNTMGRYMRSIYSNICTPPPSQNQEPENLYHLYKTAQGLSGHAFKESTGLYWKYANTEILEEED
mmetsp:Transcript_118519/g.221433  ORF Transcript_118519/g.221433 Transcript_118519/m.221433 type:complete len:602 (-) Transcript_118519:55-1860(-)